MTISKEKKTLLLSVIVIGIAATMLGAGTLAYFSSTVEIEDNLFTAGTIELSVDLTDLKNSENFTANLSDLKPCMKGWGNVTLSNTGSNPMDVWLKIYNVQTANGTVTLPEINDPSSPKEDIDTVILYDLTVDGTPEIVDTDALHIDDIEDQYIYLGEIPYEGSMIVDQSFMMECATENWAQGDTMEFTVQFFAQQSEGSPPPPSPTPELSGYTKP